MAEFVMINLGEPMDTYVFRKYVVPDHTMGAIKRYVQDGIQPGGFLTAVICNNLMLAVGKADDENMANLPAIVAYFYNKAPTSCFGSVRAFETWCAAGGVNGLAKLKINPTEKKP